MRYKDRNKELDAATGIIIGCMIGGAMWAVFLAIWAMVDQ